MRAHILRAGVVAALLLTTLPASAGVPAAPATPAPVPLEASQVPAALAADLRGLQDAGEAVVGPEVQTTDPAGAEAAAVVALPKVTHADDVADLDSDGLLDVIAHVVYDDGRAEWVALRGVDGSELYRMPAQPEFTYMASIGGDVDGDGLVDLVERRVDRLTGYAEGWEGSTCEGCPEGTIILLEDRTTMSVRSGGSGEVLWTSEELLDRLHVAEVETDTTYDFDSTNHSTRYRGLVDGRMLLEHRRYDYHYEQRYDVGQSVLDLGTLRAGQQRGQRSVDNTVALELVDPLTGAVSHTTTVTSDVADSFVGVDLADLDGDGDQDALVQAEGQRADTWECIHADVQLACVDERDDGRALHVQAVDVTSGTPLWERIEPDTGGFPQVRVIPDSTGDGGLDLLVERGSFDEATLAVWSGATGEESWSRPGDHRVRDWGLLDGRPVLLGQHSEYVSEPGEDDPLNPFDGGEATTGSRVHWIRVDATTGEELLRTTVEPVEGAEYVEVGWGPMDDYDGDGMPDPWVEAQSYTWDVDDEGVSRRRDVGEPLRHIESGATGALISQDVPAEGEDVWISSVVDLTGDAAAEVRVRDETATTYQTATGTVLWQDAQARFLSFYGDVDGSPGADVIVSDELCSFTALNGATGATVWRTEVC